MKITPLKVLRIDADKTLRLPVALPVCRMFPVRGSKVSVGVGRRENIIAGIELFQTCPVGGNLNHIGRLVWNATTKRLPSPDLVSPDVSRNVCFKKIHQFL
ncbi:hypothetical protein TNCV_3717411 [Trichonephila clavipes]|nr:hypothetical protein TNCV_3717411 [Trichonephila clavipes]